MRYNTATFPIQRCLTNRLNLTAWCSPFQTHWNVRGYSGASGNATGLLQQYGTGWYSMVGSTRTVANAGLFYLAGLDNYNPATGVTVATSPISRCSSYSTWSDYVRGELNGLFHEFLAEISNPGFQAKFREGINACGMVAFLTRDLFTSGTNCYPDRGFSAYCKSMAEAIAAAGAKVYLNTPARCVTYNPTLKLFTVLTPRASFVVDELVLAIPSQAIIDTQLAGGVIDQIRAAPEVSATQNHTTLTVNVQWAAPWWRGLLDPQGAYSFRLIDYVEGLNRMELLDTPLHRRANFLRLVYTDFMFKKDYITSLQNGGSVKVAVDAALRALRRINFPGLGKVNVPEPLSYVVKLEASERHVSTGPGEGFGPQHMMDFALAPLGADIKVALVNEAWNYVYAGWTEGAFQMAIRAAARFDGASTAAMADAVTAAGQCGLGDPLAIPSTLANEHFPPFGVYSNVVITAAAPPPPPPPLAPSVPVPSLEITGSDAQAQGPCVAECKCPSGVACECVPCVLSGRQASARAVFACGATCNSADTCARFYSSLAVQGIQLSTCTCLGAATPCPAVGAAAAARAPAASKQGLLGLLGLLGIIPIVLLCIAAPLCLKSRKHRGKPTVIAEPPALPGVQ